WEKQSDDGSLHDQDTIYFFGPAAEKINLLNATVFAGYTDWRLPSRLELESFLDLSINTPGPAVTPLFNQACTFACSVLTCSCTAPGVYWSATLYAPNPSGVGVVSFNDGTVSSISMAYQNRVGAVRGGPPL